MSKPSIVEPTRRSAAYNIAITGTSGFLGSTLLKSLEKSRLFKHIIALDKQPPPFKLKKAKWIRTDLIETGIDEKLAGIFKKYRINILIHAAVLTKPIRNLEVAHELESVGTLHLLTAAAAAKIGKLILASTTDVYGAFPDNPNFLTETHPARGGLLSSFLKDKIEVESQFLKYEKDHPESTVTILRPATVLGPTVNNFKTHFLQNKFIPTVMGFDPLIQCVHENDVLRAFLMVIQKDHPGIFNIVAKGVLPLSRVIGFLRKIPIPVPTFLLYPGAELLWYLNIGSVPSAHIHFLKYICVADGTKAWQKLKFKPVYNVNETIMSFTGKNLEKEGIAFRLEELEEESYLS